MRWRWPWPWLCTVVLLFGMQPGLRADQPGDDMVLVCRKNDPFVFCTQGCDGRDRNWRPTDPMSRGWRPEPGYCPFPTTTCCDPSCVQRPWTVRAVAAWGQYMSGICARAHAPGRWDDRGARPERTPFDH